MSEFLRAIVGRMRELASDRRHGHRKHVRLKFTVTLEAPHKVNGKRPPSSMDGYTRDINSKGLGLVVPAIRIGQRYLAGEDSHLFILLDLPSGPINVHATSVRYERLDENGANDGYLIGVRITHMSDEDRERYDAYLHDRSRD
ncbi:MAG: PilZ domain-containing protein [bacterium]